MATTVLWFRRLPRWWALPGGVLALAVLIWQVSRGVPLVWTLGPAVLVQLAGLAAVAVRLELRVGAAPLDLTLLWVAVGAVLAAEVALHGPRLGEWAVLDASAVVALVLGAQLAQSVPERLRRAFRRLADRDVLALAPERLAAFTEALERRARWWALVGGIGGATLVLVAWLMPYRGLSVEVWAGAVWLMVLESLLAWAAGERFGRMIAYGSFWRLLNWDGARLRVVAGHVDGAGGLKPLGDFFFYQSLIASIPAVYLATWWWLLPLWPGLQPWRQPILGLLAVAIAFEVLVFVLPMVSIHQAMRTQKAELLSRADGLSRTIGSLQATLSETISSEERQAAKDRIADLTEEYWRIQRTPTWPVDPSLRRRFSLNNLALILPFLGQAVGGTAGWDRMAELLRNLGSG